jgi:carotenoid cleavage oxygenase
VLDVVRHPSMFRTHILGPSEGTPTLERWHIDGRSGAVKEERLDDRGLEFPRVDERLVGLRHRFGYAPGVDKSKDSFGTDGVLVRFDLERGTNEVRSFGSGAQVGEAVFVPRDAGAAEDDGWVMVLVYDAGSDTSALHLLNGQDFGGAAQAVVQLPQRVPAGFHGNWVPDQA